MTNKNLFMGNRILLTAFEEQDAEILAAFSEDTEYLRNLDTDFALPHSSAFFKADMEATLQDRSMLNFAIRLHDRTLLGFVALHSIEWNNRRATLAIGIGDKANQCNGYGSEAIQLILDYAFNELNLNRVGLDVISNNETAIQCYKKNGFTLEGTAREAVLRNGQKLNLIYMGILEDEWRAKN